MEQVHYGICELGQLDSDHFGYGLSQWEGDIAMLMPPPIVWAQTDMVLCRSYPH